MSESLTVKTTQKMVCHYRNVVTKVTENIEFGRREKKKRKRTTHFVKTLCHSLSLR